MHRSNKSILIICLSLYLSFLSGSPTGFSETKSQVDSPHYLRLLNRTTGRAVGEAGFQAKVDSMFTTTATATRSIVQAKDAENRKIEASLESSDETLIVSGVTQKDFDKFGEEKEEENEEDELDLTQPISSKIDGTEKTHQMETIEIFRQADKEKRDDYQRSLQSDQPEEEETNNEEESNPLSNNRYYFKPTATFQDNRYVIINRLMQTGLDYDEVDDLLSAHDSQDTLVIGLMEEQGLTYGEAVDLLTVEEETF